MPSDRFTLSIRPLFSSRSRQEHRERPHFPKLSSLFNSKRSSSVVTISSLLDVLDRALVDIAHNGYVLPPQESKIAEELRDIDGKRRLPSEVYMGEMGVSCKLPRV